MAKPMIFIEQLHILLVVGLGLAACAPTVSPLSTEMPIPSVATLCPTSTAVPPTVISTLSGLPTATPAWATFPNMPTAPYTVEALYQSFEHGFMVWRGDENCVYALVTLEDQGVDSADAIIPAEMPGAYPYGYCLKVAPLAGGDVISTPPAGLTLPRGILGMVWASYDEVEMRLGYATQPETRYLATVPAVNESPATFEQPYTIPQMTLPNGHILACGSRAATAGRCDY